MGSFDHEVEVGVTADAMWLSLKDQNTLFPQLMPESVASIVVLSGEGDVGSIRQTNFGPAVHNGGFRKERIISLDIEGRNYATEELEGGHLVDYGFTKWEDYISVVSTGESSSKVVYKGVYEGPVAEDVIAKAIANTKGAITGSFKVVEAYLKSQA